MATMQRELGLGFPWEKPEKMMMSVVSPSPVRGWSVVCVCVDVSFCEYLVSDGRYPPAKSAEPGYDRPRSGPQGSQPINL